MIVSTHLIGAILLIVLRAIEHLYLGRLAVLIWLSFFVFWFLLLHLLSSRPRGPDRF
jgi:hypothetical protein